MPPPPACPDGTESSCGFDSLVEEAMKLSPIEKKNLLRLTCQLQSGDSPANVKAMCEVFGMSKKSHAWNAAAVEVKLRQMGFRQYEGFIPTAKHMTLNPDKFYEAIRVRFSSQGFWELKTYSMAQMRAELQKFIRR
jgi:hypothetical protein